MFGFFVINLIAGTKLFVFFSGWAFWICATIMMFVVLFYLLMGGFKAVVKTDILQYVAMLFILAMLALLLFKGSLIPISEWNLFRADITTLIGFFLVGFLFPFAMPELWQRVYSSRNRQSLKNGLLLSSIIYAIVAFLLALIALTVKVKFPGIDPDLALIHGFANLLPTGLLGLSVILLFAAIMSSLDTYIFTAASSIVQDFFEWNKKTTIKNIRKVIFTLAIIGTIISIWIQNLIIGSYIFVAIIVVLATPVIATWINKKIKQRTLLWGFSVGTIGFTIFLIKTISNITPTIVIVALSSTLIGLSIGGIISIFEKLTL
jgi:Na+/proline symporter